MLFYSKSKANLESTIIRAYNETYINKFYRHIETNTGRRFRLSDITGPVEPPKEISIRIMGITRYWRFYKEKMEQLI